MRDILYLHGFASSGNSYKGDFLRGEFGKHAYTPNLKSIPKLDFIIIKDILQKLNNPLLVGSSLGGFYAEYFSKKFHYDALLINPLTNVIDIQKYVGDNIYFETGKSFKFTNNDVIDLINYSNEIKSTNSFHERRLILVAKDDEVIPYTLSINHFKSKNERMLIYDNGGHSFNCKNEILLNIQEFM